MLLLCTSCQTHRRWVCLESLFDPSSFSWVLLLFRLLLNPGLCADFLAALRSQDPWLDPLPPADDAKLADKSLPPVCIVNSEYFTCWTDHFARLTSIMANWGGRPSSCWGTTVLRSRHQDFSDFPLLIDTLPGLPFASAKHTTATPESLLGTISRISESFLSSGTFCAAVDLDEWDGKCDKGRVAILQVPQPKGWFKRGEPKTKKVIEGGEGEVRVHFRGQ